MRPAGYCAAGAEVSIRSTAASTFPLATAAAGAGGFGYDPVFVPDEQPAPSRTVAEFTPAEKNAQSHRALAFVALADLLRSL